MSALKKLQVVLGLALVLGALGGCMSDEPEQVAASAQAVEGDEDTVGVVVSGQIPIDGEPSEGDLPQGTPGHGTSPDGVSGADPVQTTGLCIRTPFGPGEVKWNFHPDGTVWRSKPENGSSWVGAHSGTQDTDGIHRNGWGCNVLKIPDDCTATVNSNGSYSCCCNAALSAADPNKYSCKVKNYSAITSHKPPGCP